MIFNCSHSIKLLPLAVLVLFAAAAEALQLNIDSCLHCVVYNRSLTIYGHTNTRIL